MSAGIAYWKRMVEKWDFRIVLTLLLLHALVLGWSACWQSPTLNEPAHLASGIAIWELGRFDTYRVNPPLIRSVAALPVMLMGCKTNWNQLAYGPGKRCEFSIGMDFIKANGTDSIWQFNVARWICIPFSMLGGWCCYLWGRDLCGRGSGVLACVLWCFNPNVLAYGQVITPDVGGASLGLMASYTYWRWLRHPEWRHATYAGIMLGIALLAKSTWIVLFGIWPLLFIGLVAAQLWMRQTSNYIIALQAAHVAWMLLIGTYVLNSGYLFDETFTPLGAFQFVSKRLGNPTNGDKYGNVFTESWMGRVPVPLPKQFVLGIDHQKSDFDDFPFPSYLCGEWRETGWWYYYLYGFLVKMPSGLLILVLIATSGSLVGFKRSSLSSVAGWATLCVPGVVVVVVVSCQPSLNHHFRYVLPAFGPLFVFASSILVVFHSLAKRLRQLIFCLLVMCVVSTVCSTISCAPCFISYFNAFAGGMQNGHRHMLHSNLDWGQDLYYVKKWIQENNLGAPLRLAYYGLFDPADLGIQYLPASCGPIWHATSPSETCMDGIIAVSINYVMGDRSFLTPNCSYDELKNRLPLHICGSSIYIYRIP